MRAGFKLRKIFIKVRLFIIMPKQEEKVISVGVKVVYGILGIAFALVFLYFGLGISSSLIDLIAKRMGISYESFAVGVANLVFMIFLLLIGYLIYKLIKIKILSKFFLWTLIIVDGLYILFLLFYLSL